ncbi:MAG: toprim domain-containing protein, partial [bacterium]|nr:toprim domain-containing protein [bacterium]
MGAKTGEKEKLLNIHKDAAYFFQQNLAKNPAALDYLKERGIGSEAQKAFSLGFAPKSWNALLTYLSRKGYKPETINTAGLIVKGSKGNYDTFRERIIFPIYDLRGEIVAFGGRAVGGGEPKYLNSPETPIYNKRKVLYGLHKAKDSIKEHGYTMFMEGYLDVITAHIHGFTGAVAPLGTAITQEHGKLIKRFTEDVIIVFDSDPAGIKAAKSSASILL